MTNRTNPRPNKRKNPLKCKAHHLDNLHEFFQWYTVHSAKEELTKIIGTALTSHENEVVDPLEAMFFRDKLDDVIQAAQFWYDKKG